MSPASSLFQPLHVGELTLKNRVVMAALTRNRSVPDTVPNAVNVEYYRQRARGGASLIISEGVLVTPLGTEWPWAPGLSTPEHVEGWKKVTEAVHEEGSLIVAQIWHVGRAAHPDAPEQKKSGQPVYAPSAIAARGGKFRHIEGEPGYQVPTEIDDPQKLVDLYKQAAVNAKAAGFDGVEIHGANGYLVHQFLDNTSNERTDKWGGSVENRARFGLEILKSVSEVYGPGRVGIKLSPVGGYNDMVMPLEETIETFRYFISEADKLGIAFIELSQYFELLDPEIDGERRGKKHDVFPTYSPLVKNVKLIGNAGISPSQAAQLIQEGVLDAVSFGLLHIANPDLAKRIQHGKPIGGMDKIDWAHLYGHEGSVEEQAKGYSDYPEETYD